MDNFAYANWDPIAFSEMLMRYAHIAQSMKWVCCPDVVGDWEKTHDRFEEWHERIASVGYPLAYVLQDGQHIPLIPWHDISCLFVGGSTEYKLSAEALKICKIAKDKGKIVHIGRVNSIVRIKKFEGVMDSFDGLSYSKFSNSRLPAVLKYLEK